MSIDIDKIKKYTKNKILYRVMFTWDENNDFYVKENNGNIKPILSSFTPKVNAIVINKIKLAEKNEFKNPNVENVRYFIQIDDNSNIPVTIFKIDKNSSLREVYFELLKTYTTKYNSLN